MCGEDEKPETGVNITISEKSTDKIVKAVTDLFSPVTESMGLIGDHIRIYRERSVEKTLKRAQEIAADEGKSPELPPPKFLVPYLEAVSVEEEYDDSLRDKWARLLLNAGSKPDSYSYYARTILSELSQSEAKLLDEIVSETKVLTFGSYNEYIKYQKNKLKSVYDACENIVLKLNGGELDSKQALPAIAKEFGDLLVVSFSFKTDNDALQKDESGRASFSHRRIGDQYGSFEILQSRKLVEVANHFELGKVKGLRTSLSINWIYFTNIGFGVVKKLYAESES